VPPGEATVGANCPRIGRPAEACAPTDQNQLDQAPAFPPRLYAPEETTQSRVTVVAAAVAAAVVPAAAAVVAAVAACCCCCSCCRRSCCTCCSSVGPFEPSIPPAVCAPSSLMRGLLPLLLLDLPLTAQGPRSRSLAWSSVGPRMQSREGSRCPHSRKAHLLLRAVATGGRAHLQQAPLPR